MLNYYFDLSCLKCIYNIKLIHSFFTKFYGTLPNKLNFVELVSGLEAHPIISVACGDSHSLALNRWGEVFSWGSDDFGQLGHQLGSTIQNVPKLIRSLTKYNVVQIAAGQKHSVALTNGNVFFFFNI